MTQNGYFNNDIVRKEWGFDGVIMSDFVSTHDGVAAANGGLDLEVPGGLDMNAKTLLPAIQNGRVKVSTIDEKVVHILQTAARFGWLDRVATDLSVSTYNEANHQLALQSARETMVLLKNDGNLLPLDKSKTKSVLVVGPNAYPAQAVGGGSAHTAAFAPVSVLEGISCFLATSSVVYYERGLPSLVDLSASTEFLTAPQNGERGLKLEVYDNLDLSGKPKSTETVNHINVKGTSWDEMAQDYEAEVALFLSPPKTISRRWTGYYMAAETGAF
jgi:beta-glucosidase